MATHTHLPIYKVAYDLLGIIAGLVKNMHRDYKRSIGDKISTECLEITVLIFRANVAQDKAPHLLELIERLQIAELMLRLSMDKRLISKAAYAQAKPNQKALHPYMWSDAFPLHTTPQPDRVAELEQLRQQVADLEKERDELIEVKAAENASWNAGFNVQVDQLKKLTAERDAALNEARDFESDVDTVTQHNVELQLETIALKSALKVVSALLHEYKMGNAYKNKFVEEAITTLEGVLKHD